MKTSGARIVHFFNYFYGAFALIHLYGAVKIYIVVKPNDYDSAIALTLSMLGGMFVYLLALYLNNRGSINSAIILFITEQTIHQYVLVKYLGLNLGFQSYYFVGTVLIFFSSYRLSLKIAVIVFTFIAYSALVNYGFENTPLINPDTGTVKETILLNAAVIFATFSLLAYVYKSAVDIAEKKYVEEQEKSNQLLHNIFPADIIPRLKDNSERIADKYAEATVLFVDLVGFTEISSSMVPSMVVGIIDDIFCRFDLIVENLKLEKIKTIGDSYMVVGGVPKESDNHAEVIAKAALEMQKAIKLFNKENNENIEIRIGIHTGPLIAGVIGKKKLSYDIWGGAVNIASRMESHCEIGKIQISEVTNHLIKNKFVTKERGVITIKGKGEMKTSYLEGSRLR